MQQTGSDLGDHEPASPRHRASPLPSEATPTAPLTAATAPPTAATVPTATGCSAAATPRQSIAPGALSHPPPSVVNMQQTGSDLGDHEPASPRHQTAHTPSETTSTAPFIAATALTAGCGGDEGVLAGCPGEHSAAEPGDAGESVAGGVGDCPVGALGVLVGDPDGLDAAGLGTFLGAVRSVRSWVDAREAAALRAAVRCEAAREAGAADAAAWLGQHTGVGRREALARERTAAGLAELPEMSGALADGRLTLGHAQVLTQFAAPAGVDLSVDPEVDFPDPARDAARRVAEAVRARPEELIAAAESMSVDAYRRFLRRWADRAAGDDGAGRDVAQRRRRRVTVSETDDGMRGVRGLLPADQFAFFENELRRLAEARWRADHPDADNVPAKELTCPQRNADALVDMARRSRQLGDNNGEPLGSHIDVMVLIDQQTLTAGLHDEGRCELDDNTPISPVAARRMLCDADIIAAIGDPAAFRGTPTSRRGAGDGALRPSAAARAGSSTWATAAAPPTARSAGPSSPATAPAPLRAAIGRTGCARFTTSSRGPKAGAPTSTTSPCSAAATTTSTTPTSAAEPPVAHPPTTQTSHPTDDPTRETTTSTCPTAPSAPLPGDGCPDMPDGAHRATPDDHAPRCTATTPAGRIAPRRVSGTRGDRRTQRTKPSLVKDRRRVHMAPHQAPATQASECPRDSEHDALLDSRTASTGPGSWPRKGLSVG